MERHIGRFIGARRRQLGISVETVAKRCNVSRSCVFTWEKQRSILPKNLPVLAAALNIPIRHLIAENRRVQN